LGCASCPPRWATPCSCSPRAIRARDRSALNSLRRSCTSACWPASEPARSRAFCGPAPAEFSFSRSGSLWRGGVQLLPQQVTLRVEELLRFGDLLHLRVMLDVHLHEAVDEVLRPGRVRADEADLDDVRGLLFQRLEVVEDAARPPVERVVVLQIVEAV